MRSLRLEVSESSSRRAVFVKLIGEFDMAVGDLFAEAAAHGVANDGHATVALECSEVTFLDSSGLHALLDAKKTAEAAGASFVLVAPSPAVSKVIDVPGWPIASRSRPRSATSAADCRHPSGSRRTPNHALARVP